MTVLRTNSSLVVSLLLALHSTTRAMTPAMAAVSNTPPMKPPVAAPAPAPAQPSTEIDVQLYIMIHTIQFILIANISISHYNLNILFNVVGSYLPNSNEGVCTQHWTNSWCMATTANRGQCIRKIA